MTTSALITMILTWLVIIYFAAKYFIKVLKLPYQKEKKS